MSRTGSSFVEWALQFTGNDVSPWLTPSKDRTSVIINFFAKVNYYFDRNKNVRCRES